MPRLAADWFPEESASNALPSQRCLGSGAGSKGADDTAGGAKSWSLSIEIEYVDLEEYGYPNTYMYTWGKVIFWKRICESRNVGESTKVWLA